MMRSIDIEVSQQNQRIEEAIEGVKSGQYKDCTKAAWILKILYSTLRHRMKQQLLSEEEETELARWIRQLTVQGYPPKPYAVREMAQAIQTQCVIGINDPSITHVAYDEIGEQWVKRFMQRHLDLD